MRLTSSTCEPHDSGTAVSFTIPAGSSEAYVSGYRLYRSSDPVAGDRNGQFGEGAPSGVIAVDRDVQAYAHPSPPQLTVVQEGSRGTRDVVVDVAPAEADKNHRLSGYEWRLSPDPVVRQLSGAKRLSSAMLSNWSMLSAGWGRVTGPLSA
ncbi:hypothetical protein ACH47Z_13765 [Streptomyces sp. NPDC020192]|uniref:hypothetical protein n=1 Tax=Streptomyces sp. NPDC020192 TaxID=3365066 RepID=UPI0037A4D4EF